MTKLTDDELAGLRAAVAKQGLEALPMRRDLTDGIIATIDGLQADLDKATAELSQARERIKRLEILAQDRLDAAHEMERERDEARAELAAMRAAVPADGWKLVPVEPTREMVEVGRRMVGELALSMRGYTGHITDENRSTWPEAYEYRAMIAAAPQPPAQAVARPEAAVKAEALREAIIAIRLIGVPVGAGDGCGTRVVGSSAEAEMAVQRLIDRLEKEGA